MCWLCKEPNVWIVWGLKSNGQHEMLGIYPDRPQAWKYVSEVEERDGAYWWRVWADGHRVSGSVFHDALSSAGN